eukprot:gnl/MRDRNA2_/MRDRNA2_70747_c0_seq1.p1 gnl/MRDRNA2_/MRDRNA2_70747_c0~~gnl/MRDRNA2_/MRDRNA2_70747_c0_seq1.p1  ORF type:complete len:705 (+),score=118.54 gnl/MRDRNA2_/MRDRNA2_70747_c0_seq1:78-2117(+)
MYPVEFTYGVVYVSERRLIMKHYLKTWFFIDFMSILPFDILGLLLQSGDVRQLKLLRVVRLLRLLKLARLLRGLRILKRWEVEVGISYRRMTLFGLLVTVCLAAHWIGCFLGIVSSLEGDVCHGLPDDAVDCTMTWFSPAAMEMVESGKDLTGYHRYVVALYVASTVIVHPHALPPKNEFEYIPFIMLIFFGGFIWTRVISRSTALITSMDRHVIHYQQTMDDLNIITAQHRLSTTLRRRLRCFFMNTRDSSQRDTWVGLTKRMSPTLKLEVLYQMSKDWIRRVPYLAGTSKLFLMEITMHLNSQRYGQKEVFGDNFRLYIMKAGICNWIQGEGKNSLLRAGCVWGEEHLLLNNWELLRPNTASSITFVEVLSLDRDMFTQVCSEYPEYDQTMRWYYRNYAVSRGIMVYAAKSRKGLTPQSSKDFKLPKEFTDEEDVLADSIKDQQGRAKRQLRKSVTSPSNLDSKRPKKPLLLDIVREADPSSPKSNGPQNRKLDNSSEVEKRLTERLDTMRNEFDGRFNEFDSRFGALETMLRKEFAALRSRDSGQNEAPVHPRDERDPGKDSAKLKMHFESDQSNNQCEFPTKLIEDGQPILPVVSKASSLSPRLHDKQAGVLFKTQASVQASVQAKVSHLHYWRQQDVKLVYLSEGSIAGSKGSVAALGHKTKQKKQANNAKDYV